MRYVINRSLERQYELLKLLLLENKPVTKHYAAEFIGCSRPTLDRMIETIKNLITDYGDIYYSEGGLQLDVKENFSLRHVRALILRETFLYQLLSDLLFKEVPSIESWAADHFVSTSFSYKYFRKATKLLNEMGIQLNTNKPALRLVGDEWHIRYLYFLLYKEISLVDETWPFETLPYPAIKSFVRKLCNELEIYASPLIEYQISLFTAIHLSRANKADEEIQRTTELDSWLSVNTKEALANMFDKLADSTGCTISNQDRSLVLKSLECFPLRYLSDQAVSSRIRYSKTFSKSVYKVAYDFMFILEGRPESDEYQFARYLDVFAYYNLMPFQKEIIFETEEEFKQTKARKDINPKVAAKTIPILNKLRSNGSANFVLRHWEDILFEMSLIYQCQSKRVEPKKPINVTILSEHGLDKENVIAEWLGGIFSQDTVKIIDNRYAGLSTRESEIDMIIGDYFSLELQNNYQCFLVDDHFSRKHRDKLEEKIRFLYDEKNGLSQQKAIGQ